MPRRRDSFSAPETPASLSLPEGAPGPVPAADRSLPDEVWPTRGGADSPLAELLTRIGSESSLDNGSYLWREGDPGDEVVLLLEGTLEVVSRSPEGNLVVLARLDPVTVLGEIACIDRRARSAGIRAVSDVRVVRTDADEFRGRLRSRPDILEQLLFQQIEIVRRLTGQVTRHHQRAITDPLTGLYNVGFFHERLGLELDRASRTGDSLSVVMLDIDWFKRYNDAHGHQAGDEALFRVARILKENGRRGDIVARYGGEEFVVLLYGANKVEALRFAEGARGAIEATEFAGGDVLPGGGVTLSGGVATYPDDATDQKRLVAEADRHLYRAKQAGRNRVEGAP